MSTIWFVSDTHFGHANMVATFKQADGTPARDFASVEEMDETMIARWNEVVRPADHVWHLGDLCMARGNHTERIDHIMRRLKGHKRLILGNHDMLKPRWYAEHFEKVAACRLLDGLLFTHIPVAPFSLGKAKANVHGHVHWSSPKVYTATVEDPATRAHIKRPYVNVCVERTEYQPVSLEEIKGWLFAVDIVDGRTV